MSPRHAYEPGEGLPQPGDVIAGKYVVENVVKRGGMGIVLAARHTELGKPVAIKVLLPELAADASMVTRFLREGRAVSALRSDHVVRVHDVGRLDGGTPYLVMEMLHGSDLDRRVRKGGPLPWQEAVGYVMQACEALVEAHSLGIIHRDLKPSNLFLVDLPSGISTVKVLDFGISKTDGLDVPLGDGHAITTTEAVLGSPTFMAPEQLKSAKYVDARADIWSLGLVLHFLIAGKLAFDAETLGAYLIKILQEPPIPLRTFRPDAPAEIEAIVLKCLEKDPAMRFASASDLRAVLAPFAPFAAHASGVYAAARISGNYTAAVPPPIFTGLSPSAPTPVGGVMGAALVTPVAPYPAGVAITPLGGVAAPSNPSAPVPSPFAASGHLSSSAEMPSVQPFADLSTQASWTSMGKPFRPRRLPWVLAGAGLALSIAVIAALLSGQQAPPVPASAVSASAVALAPTGQTAAPTGAPSSEPAAPTSAASTSAAPSDPVPSAASPPPPSAQATAAKGPSAAPTGGTGPKPKGTSTKRVSGPMETDL
ncbi:MAG: serine/threonine protein kinase [Polyangiaceae bacterium]|nr:serine/threonine protein kinase [Polyangiaceae bacterium]